MECFNQKNADWSKFMNNLISYMNDQERQKVNSSEILEDTKKRLISFLVDNGGMD